MARLGSLGRSVTACGISGHPISVSPRKDAGGLMVGPLLPSPQTRGSSSRRTPRAQPGAALPTLENRKRAEGQAVLTWNTYHAGGIGPTREVHVAPSFVFDRVDRPIPVAAPVGDARHQCCRVDRCLCGAGRDPPGWIWVDDGWSRWLGVDVGGGRAHDDHTLDTPGCPDRRAPPAPVRAAVGRVGGSLSGSHRGGRTAVRPGRVNVGAVSSNSRQLALGPLRPSCAIGTRPISRMRSRARCPAQKPVRTTRSVAHTGNGGRPRGIK